MTLIEEFRTARRVSTPLVVIRTTDAASVMASLQDTDADGAVIQWDAAQGFAARTELGATAIAEMTGGNQQVLNPADAMFQLRTAPAGSIVFVMNAHRIWQDISTAQAIWNLRDIFKSNGRTLVLLTTPEAKAPRELDSDVIVIDDLLPDSDALAEIVTAQCVNAEPPLPSPNEKTLRKAVDALKGLSAFVAEQVVAMCLTRRGIDISALWERKRQVVEQTPGATVFRKLIRFSDIGGHEGLKRDLLREVNSKRPVKVVVIFDEFEKSLGGSGDTSGVSQDASKVVLTYMQDHDVRGAILFGHPGAGKTLVAKAMSSEADCLCIMADMGAMKGSLVGESEAKIRQFFTTVSAIAGDGGAFFVATCNSTGALTTEMRRRFKTGFYFVDLPTRCEMDAVWNIHRSKRGIEEQLLPDDMNWTGAEIESCCEKAENYSITLVEAAKSIVPVAQAQPELIDGRRREANRRLLSSTTGIAYEMPEMVPAPTKTRSVSVN